MPTFVLVGALVLAGILVVLLAVAVASVMSSKKQTGRMNPGAGGRTHGKPGARSSARPGRGGARR